MPGFVVDGDGVEAMQEGLTQNAVHFSADPLAQFAQSNYDDGNDKESISVERQRHASDRRFSRYEHGVLILTQIRERVSVADAGNLRRNEGGNRTSVQDQGGGFLICVDGE